MSHLTTHSPFPTNAGLPTHETAGQEEETTTSAGAMPPVAEGKPGARVPVVARKASSQLAPSAEQAAAPAPAAFMAEGKSERQDSDGEEEMEGDQASVADSMAESVQLEMDGGRAQEDCCDGEEEKGQEEQEQPQTEMAGQPGEARKRGGPRRARA